MKFKQGLILGRFQSFHKGHEHLINKALEVCDNLLILIGSSDKSGTKDNPFDYETRKFMLETVYGDKIKIAPLPDLGVGNVNIWGEYVIKNAIDAVGPIDCIIYGIEDKCETWFSEERRKEINFVKVDRSEINISATVLRNYMYDNNYEEWKKYVNPSLYKYYADLRTMLIKAYL